MARGAASRKKRKATRSRAATAPTSTQTFVVSKDDLLRAATLPPWERLAAAPARGEREGLDHAHEWGGVEAGFLYCGADGCIARRAISDDEAASFVWGSPERALLEQVRAALAADDPMDGDCADCGHVAASHAGPMNDGACTVEDCACDAMVPADGPPEEVAAEVVAFSPSDPLIEAAVSALTDHAPECAPIVRLRLEELRLVHFADGAVALPDAHQPGESLPDRHASPAAPEVAPPATVGGQLRWRASLVPEATLTDDGRAFAPDSISWRELPLTLMAMIETTEGGHVGALVAGRIDRIWRDANGMLWGEGVFDEGDYGSEIGRMVGDGTLRGVSVDVAVHSYEVGPRSDWFDDDGNWAPKEEASDERSLADLLFDESEEPVIFVVTEGVIGAATVCPFQAFADAKIELAASLAASAQSPALWTVTQQAGWTVTACACSAAADVDYASMTEEERRQEYEMLLADGLSEAEARGTVWPEALTAAAEGLAPVAPPAAWFENPALGELTPLVVTAEGRVYGHAAAWDTCHIGIPDVCTTAPHSNAAYAYFLLKEVECEDGERVACGTITLETGHAGRSLGRQQAAAHYDDTGMAAADVVCGEDEHGIWVAGAVRSTLDAEKVRELRGAVLSGDWRNVNGNLELVALLAVNVPGFPVPRARALVAAGDDGQVALSLVAAGLHNGPVRDGEFVSAEAREKIAALHGRAAGAFAALAARARDAA